MCGLEGPDGRAVTRDLGQRLFENGHVVTADLVEGDQVGRLLPDQGRCQGHRPSGEAARVAAVAQVQLPHPHPRPLMGRRCTPGRLGRDQPGDEKGTHEQAPEDGDAPPPPGIGHLHEQEARAAPRRFAPTRETEPALRPGRRPAVASFARSAAPVSGAFQPGGGPDYTTMTAPPRRGSPAPTMWPEAGSRRTAWQPPKKRLGPSNRAIAIPSRSVGSAPGST